MNNTRRTNVAVTLSARNLQHLYPDPEDEATSMKSRTASYSSSSRKESLAYRREDAVKDPNLLHTNVLYRDSSFSKTIDKIISQPKIRSIGNRQEVRPINPMLKQESTDDELENLNNKISTDAEISVDTPNEVKELKRQFSILNQRLSRLEDNISNELKNILTVISNQNGALQNGALQNDALQNDALQNDTLQNDALQNDALQNDASVC